MKYTYAYKTSDGVRHEDSMNASSRDEVFAELRKRGIKAIKVVAADGRIHSTFQQTETTLSKPSQ